MDIYQILHIILLVISLMAIIFTFGVVWRVERKLDLSYKFILVAIIFFTCGVVFDLFKSLDITIIKELDLLIKFLFLIFFTWGIYKMRALIKDINEEVIKKDK